MGNEKKKKVFVWGNKSCVRVKWPPNWNVRKPKKLRKIILNTSESRIPNSIVTLNSIW